VNRPEPGGELSAGEGRGTAVPAGLGPAGTALLDAYEQGHAAGKRCVNPFPRLIIYAWVCPWCNGGREPFDTPSGCLHCAGAGITDDVAGWDPAELARAPRPPAVMARPCHDCAFRPGSPEQDSPSVTISEESPFYCHQGLPAVNGRYQPTAYLGTLPLGSMVCAGWWDTVTGAQPPTKPYRELPHTMSLDETPHHCDETCLCPKCGALMYYSRRAREHGCTDPDCVYAVGEHHVSMPTHPLHNPAPRAEVSL